MDFNNHATEHDKSYNKVNYRWNAQNFNKGYKW